MRRRAVVLAVGLGLLPTGAVRAQGTEPLGKADLVRVLATGALTKSDIVALVGRNCVTFRPTERDRADLRAAGADDTVLAALDQCVRTRLGRGPAGPAGPARAAGAAGAAKRAGPAAPPREAAGLRVIVAPRVAAEAGTGADVLVRLLRGATPQPGVQLLLRGVSAIPGSLAQDPVAVTNARGFASFGIPAGTTAGTYRLTLAFSNGQPIGPAGQIDLITTATRAARAVVVPAALSPIGGTVTITVTDGYGNRVVGAPLELRPLTGALAGTQPSRTTDTQGQATFALPATMVRRAGEVGVFVRGMRVGSLAITLQPLVLSDQGTQFTRGLEQHGPVGTRLEQPLVLEAHDTTGAPLAGQLVEFAVSGAELAPAAATSDSSGAVRVRVTLGRHAGPVIVTAKVGTLTRTATVHADPGPATELVVERDGVAVTGPVPVRSRDAVVLRVVARDTYGNETALTPFTAVASGPTIRLRGASAAGAQGVVTIEPRASGAGQVEVRGSGLETRVALQVALPVTLPEGWVLGARGSWTGFSYAYKPLPYIQGRPGVRGELFAGHALSPRLRLELTGGFGSLKADSAAREVSVALTQGYVRAEYALAPDRAVVPLLAFGGGAFRIKSDDRRHIVYHTSFFWLAGVGFDARVSRSAIAEVRLETHQLNEMSTPYVTGHVGALTVVEAGLRVAP